MTKRIIKSVSDGSGKEYKGTGEKRLEEAIPSEDKIYNRKIGKKKKLFSVGQITKLSTYSIYDCLNSKNYSSIDQNGNASEWNFCSKQISGKEKISFSLNGNLEVEIEKIEINKRDKRQVCFCKIIGYEVDSWSKQDASFILQKIEGKKAFFKN